MSDIHMVLDALDMERIVKKMAQDVIAAHSSMDNLALIGVHSRGVFLARRLQRHIALISGIELPVGAVDINLYRDDWTRIGAQPVVRKSDIAFNIDEMQVILIDDVLYTGRTVRAAMDALMDFGRPARIELAVLIDRGHRELPIHSDYTGQIITTTPEEAVNVLVTEMDGADRVDVIPGK